MESPHVNLDFSWRVNLSQLQRKGRNSAVKSVQLCLTGQNKILGTDSTVSVGHVLIILLSFRFVFNIKRFENRQKNLNEKQRLKKTKNLQNYVFKNDCFVLLSLTMPIIKDSAFR